MPQFSPNEARVAIAPMSNPTAKGFSYTAELYLGLLKAASSGVISFFLSAGETRNISFPITMPSAEGTYPVYLDVFVAGQLIGAFQAIEDVVIGVPVPLAPCVYCGATFTTEAALVSHMESNHPGKPYVVYAYLSKDTVGFDYIWMDGWRQKDWITVYAKVFTPTALATGEKYSFRFWFYKTLTYGYWPCSPHCSIAVKGPAPEGFYVEESSDLRPRYLTSYPYGTVVDVPFGTYPLYSTCYFVKADGSYSVEWENVDTGLTITVV